MKDPRRTKKNNKRSKKDCPRKDSDKQKKILRSRQTFQRREKKRANKVGEMTIGRKKLQIKILEEGGRRRLIKKKLEKKQLKKLQNNKKLF